MVHLFVQEMWNVYTRNADIRTNNHDWRQNRRVELLQEEVAPRESHEWCQFPTKVAGPHEKLRDGSQRWIRVINHGSSDHCSCPKGTWLPPMSTGGCHRRCSIKQGTLSKATSIAAYSCGYRGRCGTWVSSVHVVPIKASNCAIRVSITKCGVWWTSMTCTTWQRSTWTLSLQGHPQSTGWGWAGAVVRGWAAIPYRPDVCVRQSGHLVSARSHTWKQSLRHEAMSAGAA